VAGEGGRAVMVVAFETDKSYVDLRPGQLRARSEQRESTAAGRQSNDYAH
jgi:hypothetical protein